MFQQLVLDQGYYPNGIMTAQPSEQALIDDIKLSMAAGFKRRACIRKCSKNVFCFIAINSATSSGAEFWRRLKGSNGYGPDGNNQQHTASFITEWLEAVERDYSHPAIVGWCPLNETCQTLTDNIAQLDVVTRAMFLATKAFDPSRPVLDTSGYFSHRVPESDVYDCHDYEQDPVKFKANRRPALRKAKPFVNTARRTPTGRLRTADSPYFVSEFGGILWNPKAKPGEDSWGYGDKPKTLEEFYERFEKLCAVLLDDANMFGYCYTQLTDVFQEQNGIYSFDRSEKFDLTRIKKAQVRAAAIEEAR